MDSGASLHMTSENELSSAEKQNREKIKQKPKNPPPLRSGEAQATGGAAVFVNHLDVFCHNAAVERFTSSGISGFTVRRTGLLL